MADAHKGAIEYGDNTIIPDVTLDAPTTVSGGGQTCPIGEVIAIPTQASPTFFGVMANSKEGNAYNTHGDVVSVGVNKHYRVRKKAATALAKYDLVTFELVSGQNYYEADEAASGEGVFGIVMTAAASSDTTVHIMGPYFNAGNSYYSVP